MPLLRESTKRAIRQKLERSHFTESSFTVQYADGDREFLAITFLPNKSFKFTASQSYGSFSTSEAPGEHVLGAQTFKRVSMDDCLEAIAPWIGRILEDYRSNNPIVDEFEALRKSLSEQIEAHLGDESVHFSASEVAAMRGKLDELVTKLNEVTEKTSEQEKQLREAQQEIGKLKADLELFPKSVWYRMAGTKVLNIIKKAATSPEGRSFALEAAKKFLLEGPK